MTELYKWIHDDITWCGNECSHTDCERNIVNKLCDTGCYSMAMFKGTETCPYVAIEFTCPWCGKKWIEEQHKDDDWFGLAIKQTLCAECGATVKVKFDGEK